MKKIEFGHANDATPTGSWQALGIQPDLMLCDAEFIGTIAHQDERYIVARVDKDEYNHYPELLGKFIVRDSVVDLFADGSTILYLNQQQSVSAQTIQKYLNMESIKGQITEVNDIPRYLNGVYVSPEKKDKLIEMDSKIIATSITPEAFAAKRNAIKNCHKPFSHYGEPTLEKEKTY